MEARWGTINKSTFKVSLLVASTFSSPWAAIFLKSSYIIIPRPKAAKDEVSVDQVVTQKMHVQSSTDEPFWQPSFEISRKEMGSFFARLIYLERTSLRQQRGSLCLTWLGKVQKEIIHRQKASSWVEEKLKEDYFAFFLLVDQLWDIWVAILLCQTRHTCNISQKNHSLTTIHVLLCSISTTRAPVGANNSSASMGNLEQIPHVFSSGTQIPQGHRLIRCRNSVNSLFYKLLIFTKILKNFSTMIITLSLLCITCMSSNSYNRTCLQCQFKEQNTHWIPNNPLT